MGIGQLPYTNGSAGFIVTMWIYERKTCGSLGTGVGISDSDPLTTMSTGFKVVGVIDGTDVVAVATCQRDPSVCTQVRPEGSRIDLRLVPTTVSRVTILSVPSSCTPLRILLLEAQVGD
jgi:hypothetical protein